jgi:hypothetical protein
VIVKGLESFSLVYYNSGGSYDWTELLIRATYTGSWSVRERLHHVLPLMRQLQASTIRAA